MGIAIALIVMMAITAVLSMVSVTQVGDHLEELTQSYIPAYGDLARANIRSVERALALRRMIIERSVRLPAAISSRPSKVCLMPKAWRSSVKLNLHAH